MYDLLKAICYFTLFFGIVVVKKHDQWLKYVPQYRYDQDPFFVKLHSHASKGFIISNNVQMYRGLNLQVATGKQYFMPRKVVLQGKDNKIDLYCVGDQSIDLKMFFEKRVAECFKSRPLKEWQEIAKLLGVNLVITEKGIKLMDLNMIDENEGLNVYEIPK